MDETRIKLLIKHKVYPAQLRDELIKMWDEKQNYGEWKKWSKFMKIHKFCKQFWYDDKESTVKRIKKLEEIYKHLTNWEKKS